MCESKGVFSAAEMDRDVLGRGALSLSGYVPRGAGGGTFPSGGVFRDRPAAVGGPFPTANNDSQAIPCDPLLYCARPRGQTLRLGLRGSGQGSGHLGQEEVGEARRG